MVISDGQLVINKRKCWSSLRSGKKKSYKKTILSCREEKLGALASNLYMRTRSTSDVYLYGLIEKLFCSCGRSEGADPFLLFFFYRIFMDFVL